MGTYESEVTSCSIIACGNIGANASGPTGSMVAGFKGGSSWKGRSGTRLYQLSGMAFSSRTNLVVSTITSRFLAVSWTSAYSFSRRGVCGRDARYVYEADQLTAARLARLRWAARR